MSAGQSHWLVDAHELVGVADDENLLNTSLRGNQEDHELYVLGTADHGCELPVEPRRRHIELWRLRGDADKEASYGLCASDGTACRRGAASTIGHEYRLRSQQAYGGCQVS